MDWASCPQQVPLVSMRPITSTAQSVFTDINALSDFLSVSATDRFMFVVSSVKRYGCFVLTSDFELKTKIRLFRSFFLHKNSGTRSVTFWEERNWIVGTRDKTETEQNTGLTEEKQFVVQLSETTICIEFILH